MAGRRLWGQTWGQIKLPSLSISRFQLLFLIKSYFTFTGNIVVFMLNGLNLSSYLFTRNTETTSSPACSDYWLIPGTSTPHILHLSSFSITPIKSHQSIAPFYVMNQVNGMDCHLKSKMLIPLKSSKCVPKQELYFFYCVIEH